MIFKCDTTKASLFSQGPSLQALDKCYSVCWQEALFGMGAVKMDIDKNNKDKAGKTSISEGFFLRPQLLLPLVTMKSYFKRADVPAL